MRHKNVYQKSSLLLTVFLCTFFIYQSANYPIHDFANSYFPAFLLSRNDFTADVFDPYLFNRTIAALGFSDVFASFNPNPPSVAVLFYPFTLLDAKLAKVFFNILSVLVFLIVFYRLFRFFNWQDNWIILLMPLIFFTPLRNNILFGQWYLLITALIIEGFLAYAQRKNILASMLWTISIFIKVFPLIIFLFLVLRKEYKMMLILSISCIILFLTCLLFQGSEIWKMYFTEVLPRAAAGDLHSAYTTSTQSSNMLLKYLFVHDEVFNSEPMWSNNVVHGIAKGIISGLILSFVISFITGETSKYHGLSILICSTQLLSPQGSSYSILLLSMIIPILFSTITSKQMIVMLMLLLLIGNVPISYFQPLTFPLNFLKLFMFGLFISLLFFFSGTLFNARWFLFISVVLSVFSLIPLLMEQDSSVRIVDTEFNSLITNYSIDQNKLCYSHWTEKGEMNKCTDMEIIKEENNLMAIQNNQLFYNGQQLTNSTDNKKQPVFVKTNEILYLSDKGKGYKFYALRKIKVP
jgi:hypothetical protein